ISGMLRSTYASVARTGTKPSAVRIPTPGTVMSSNKAFMTLTAGALALSEQSARSVTCMRKVPAVPNSSSGMSACAGSVTVTDPSAPIGAVVPMNTPSSISVNEVGPKVATSRTNMPAARAGGKPTGAEKEASTVDAASGSTATVTTIESDLVASATLVAVIVAAPPVTALTMPSASTVATVASSVDQVTAVSVPLPAVTSTETSTWSPRGTLRSPPRICTLTTPLIVGPQAVTRARRKKGRRRTLSLGMEPPSGSVSYRYAVACGTRCS